MYGRYFAQQPVESEPVTEVDLCRSPSFLLGGILVEPSSLQIVRAGVREKIEPKAMKVLVALADKRGAVVPRAELLERCWAGRHVGVDAVQRCIDYLRKIGRKDDAFGIETVPRVGYRLVVSAPPPALEPSDVRSPVAFSARLWPRLSLAVAVVTLLISIPAAVLTLRATPVDSAGSDAAMKAPRRFVWDYGLGKGADAPNGFRFWSRNADGGWDEAFSDGSVRTHFTFLSEYRLAPLNCYGALARRDKTLIVFIPYQSCKSQFLMAEDINPKTGEIKRPWFRLGVIQNAVY